MKTLAYGSNLAKMIDQTRLNFVDSIAKVKRRIIVIFLLLVSLGLVVVRFHSCVPRFLSNIAGTRVLAGFGGMVLPVDLVEGYTWQFDQGELDAAGRILEVAQRIDYDPARSVWIGQISASQGDWQSVVDKLGRDWDKLGQRRRVSTWLLASAFDKQGWEEQANTLWRETPEATIFLYARAMRLLKKGLPEQACVLVERGELLYPNKDGRKAPIFQALCIEFRTPAKAKDAIVWCQKLVQVSDRAGSHFLLGRAFLATQDYARAVSAFQESIARDPKSASAWNYLGSAYEAQGMLELALKAYQSSVQLDPGYAYGRLSLADLYARLGMRVEALREYENLRHSLPQQLIDERIRRLTVAK